MSLWGFMRALEVCWRRRTRRAWSEGGGIAIACAPLLLLLFFRANAASRDSKLLATSLPPPPSAMSPSSSHSGSTASDREDDDPPPDFTSHIPLTGSPTPRRRTAASTTLPPPRWGGIQLGGPTGGILGSRRSRGMGAKERALWRWINVEDLDGFLQEVYLYYVGKGIWAIGLSRLLNLL